MLDQLAAGFVTTVEVVPPAGPDASALMEKLKVLDGLSFWGFSVATNPVAKARMNNLAMCTAIGQHSGRPCILHTTTRDHNMLALQGLLWGARQMGITTALVATGDFVALTDRPSVSTVGDMDVYGLTRLARETGLTTGVVFDPNPAKGGLEQAAARLARKAQAGAQFAVTQPVYDRAGAEAVAEAVRASGLPTMLGILPLRSPRHADFLHAKVAGIDVPESIREKMHHAIDPAQTGIDNARHMLGLARELFAGACLMPAFDRFGDLAQLLSA